MSVYAVKLGSGQSLTVADAYNTSSQNLIYNGVSGGLLVVLTQQQYTALEPSQLLGLTDVSNPLLPILHVAIPTSANGVFVAGTFSYCGFSIATTAASVLTLSDANGGGTGVSGTAATAQVIEYITLAANASLSEYYPSNGDPGSGNTPGAIPITDGPAGGLSLSAHSGTYTGVVRICGR